MGWKGKQALEGGAMLMGALGLIALVVGNIITPGNTIDARDVYWGSAFATIGSVLIASGVVTFVASRMREYPS